MASKIAVADATIDGTTDFKPLRSKQYDIRKQHISETPITLKNWYKHVDWLNTTFILLIHFAAMIAAYWVPLRLNTFIFALVYYFNTGLGITAGMF
jgi:stearoyl-CoA desaturase (delta-9 desaturase)